MYAARTRNGFTPTTRAQLFKKMRPLEIPECPFANLPEAKSGRWGQGLTVARMKECRWHKPVLEKNSSSWNGLARTPAVFQDHRAARRQKGA
jgi:hypothetical protein